MYDPNHPEWQAFVRKMRASAADDIDRRVFADWLDEHEPQGLLGKFIRAQIELKPYGNPLNGLGLPTIGLYHPGMPGCSAQLAEQYAWQAFWGQQRSFLGDLSIDDRIRWRFSRGFPTVVCCDYDHWVRFGDMICAIGPVGEVVLTSMVPLYEHRGTQFVTYGLQDDRVSRRIRADRQEYLMTRREWGLLSTTAERMHERLMAEKLMLEAWPDNMVESFRISTR